VIARAKKPQAPTDDKRWKLVDVVMSRNGYSGSALIEALHKVQECFGYLDDLSMTYVARCLGLPLSKVYGVATFYHLFTLKPTGEHTCVICTGTACYIKGSERLVNALAERYRVRPGETTADKKLSVMQARCLGACGLAPAAVVDRNVIGKQSPEELLHHVEEVLG
jgi:bidirectional [NiFe] hydrogenase diaphorase subunit